MIIYVQIVLRFLSEIKSNVLIHFVSLEHDFTFVVTCSSIGSGSRPLFCIARVVLFFLQAIPIAGRKSISKASVKDAVLPETECHLLYEAEVRCLSGGALHLALGGKDVDKLFILFQDRTIQLFDAVVLLFLLFRIFISFDVFCVAGIF